MRLLTKTAVLSGAFLLAAAPCAFAGFDEAGENSFFSHQSVSAPASTEARGHSRNEQYRATYAQPTANAPAAAAASKDPSYFYHAMGTMSSQ